jgi:fermentation-respiration switch protein FrsA (DUF1100 family)
VFGRSLGGAVAVELATRSVNKERIAAVLLENTFTSIPDIARLLFPFRVIKLLPVWFYKNQFKSGRKACRITQPTLFLSGLSDQLIPPGMMTELYTMCGAPVKRLARCHALPTRILSIHLLLHPLISPFISLFYCSSLPSAHWSYTNPSMSSSTSPLLGSPPARTTRRGPAPTTTRPLPTSWTRWGVY